MSAPGTYLIECVGDTDVLDSVKKSLFILPAIRARFLNYPVCSPVVISDKSFYPPGWIRITQKRQFTYNVTLRRVRSSTVPVEKRQVLKRFTLCL